MLAIGGSEFLNYRIPIDLSDTVPDEFFTL